MKNVRFLCSYLAVTMAVGGAGMLPAAAQGTFPVAPAIGDTVKASTLDQPATEIPLIADPSLRIDPDLIRVRIGKLQKQVPLTYNSYTHEFIETFAFRKAYFTKAMLEKMTTYFPIYEKYLAQYGLPDELKYLSLIESGLNPRVISYAGAGGLWQFMPRTARLDFGLRMDEYVDERFDPVKSTEAACKYFRQLYRIFGDWEMVLASYNSGPGTVRRAIRRSGNQTGFWDVYDNLPTQTRGYVPQYVAMMYMINHAADHGIQPELIENPVPFDTVHINGYANLQLFAAVSGIPYETIQKLNPHILTNVLPERTRDFPLRIPSSSSAYVAANRRAIFDSAGRNPFNRGTQYASTLGMKDSTQVREVAEVTVEEDEEAPIVRTRQSKQVVKVRRGETLGRIAERHNVSLASLRQWNRLGRRGTVMAGQNLVIYREMAQVRYVAKRGLADRSSEITKRLKAKTKFHTVRRGDTLWSIAERYNGLTINELKRMNRIRGNSVKPGMKIRVS